MPSKRRVFGPLFHATLVLAAVYCSGLGLWYAWPTISERWTIWSSIQELRAKNPKVRDQAEARLKQIGPGATPAVLRALKDSDARVRRHCCRILEQICNPSDATLVGMIEALENGDLEVLGTSASILSRFWAYDRAVGDERTWDRVIQALRRRLGDPAPAIRSAVADALGSFGPRARPALADLLRAADDPEPAVRAAAASALARVGPGNPGVIAALRRLLRDRSPAPRSCSAGALEALGPGAESAIADLERTTHDTDPSVRTAAASALASISPRNPRAIAALREIMADPARELGLYERLQMKHDAAEVLKAKAGEAVLCATILALLEHPETSVRLDMLMNIRAFFPLPGRLVAALRNSLGDRDVRVRGEAADILLWDVGQKPDEEIIAALVAAVNSPAETEEDLHYLSYAIGSLRRVAPRSAPQVTAALVASLDRLKGRTECNIVHWIVHELGRLGPDAAPAIPALVEIAKSQAQLLSSSALAALARIDPETAETVEQDTRPDDPVTVPTQHECL